MQLPAGSLCFRKKQKTTEEGGKLKGEWAQPVTLGLEGSFHNWRFQPA